jgi:hypothetical protein
VFYTFNFSLNGTLIYTADREFVDDLDAFDMAQNSDAPGVPSQCRSSKDF